MTSRRVLITLDRLLELLVSVIVEESLSEDEVDALLEAAEKTCLAVGPWDESATVGPAMSNWSISAVCWCRRSPA
ncbi:hypothetical protein ACIQJT_29585 [Streptomyces sp. NPDC091972]|uniref:hypothetical protein n=1 Tax=Streptomyces sp. NPDC091972 TaxID=3366007 RepID=UPI00382BADF0